MAKRKNPMTVLMTSLTNFSLQVSLTQARIDMCELDDDGDGFLQPQVVRLRNVLSCT